MKEVVRAVYVALGRTSEPLRALLLALGVIFLKELVPAWRDVNLDVVVLPLVGYMVAKGLEALGRVVVALNK
jgi:hypothetical protein